MDVVLEVCDTYLLDRVYAYLLPAFPQHAIPTTKLAANATLTSLLQQATTYVHEPSTRYLNLEPSVFAYMSQWSRDNIYRQCISLFSITWIFAIVLYFTVATASYLFVFDHENFKHPKYLKNQMKMEVWQSLSSFPTMALCTLFPFLMEVRGYSKMYDSSADGPGLWYDILQIPFFICFTDCFIYMIHRGLHHPLIYKHLHKAHHKWVVPTPFASHAFHPLDGFAQSIPYHVFPFLFPLSKFAYIGLFTFVNLWTVMIHDGEYATNNLVINGAACHTMHHLYVFAS